MYAVIACPRCRRARVVEEGRKQAACGACGRALKLADMRTFHTSEGLDEARHAAGRVNAKLSGRESEFASALIPSAPRRVRHDDATQRAAAATRGASSEKDRADLAARALGAFDEAALACAFESAGLPSSKAGSHLTRMLATAVVYEPTPGRYVAL